MKILFIVTWYTPFKAKIIREGIFHYELALALKQYADVAIYFPFDTSIPIDFSSTDENNVHIFRRHKTNSRIKNFRNYIADYRQIKKEFNPDFIHAHVGQGAGFVALVWKKLFHVPYIVTEHLPVQMMNLGNKMAYYLLNVIYKNSFSTTCVSKDLHQKLKVLFPKRQYLVIYNGVILSGRNLETNQFKIYKPSKINCAIVASFYDAEIKGYQYLLPAIRNIIEKGIDICLHICGGGQYEDYYRKLAASLEIADRCIFYGQINKDKVYSIISQMDFVVSASLFESAGVSVEEAMLIGKPLVVTRSGGASSLVTDKTAIIVDTKSTQALENGILQIISRLKEFDSSAIKEYAYRNFEMSTVCMQYMNLYRQIKL